MAHTAEAVAAEVRNILEAAAVSNGSTQKALTIRETKVKRSFESPIF